VKVVIVFNHPYEGSYCNALLNSATNGLQRAGHEVDLINLDNDNFDPVMRATDLKGFKDGVPSDPQVLKYRDRLQDANHLVMLFPIWWELMPAMTKGFIDKVIFPGVAYDYDHSGRYPKMIKRWNEIRGITLVTTMNTPSFFYKLVFGNAITKAVFRGTFMKLGFKNRKWLSFNMVKFVSEQKRRKWLKQTEEYFFKIKSNS
jgi:NAD(P)H dehydrogenase (quinone)